MDTPYSPYANVAEFRQAFKTPVLVMAFNYLFVIYGGSGLKMYFLSIKTTAAAMTAGAVLAIAGSASAATMFAIDVGYGTSFSTNTPATGSSASFDFSFAQVGANVEMTVDVENTTGDVTFGSGATESKMMGFAFETPDAVSLVPGGFVGSSFFGNLLANDSSVNGGPFNSITFDYGAGNKTTLMGPGNPNGGLGQDDGITSVVFTFGGALEAAMAAAFEDGFESGALALGLRFKAVNGTGAGSDKLLYTGSTDMPAVPLPAAGWMLIAGLGGLAAMKRRKGA